MNCYESQMHGRIFLGFLGTILAIIFLASAANCQDLPPQDFETMRRILAERNFYKAKAEEAERQRDEWKAASDAWSKMYDARGRIINETLLPQIAELKTANTELREAVSLEKRAVEVFRQQSARDGEYIKSLEKRNASLKRQRLLFGIGGFALGTVAGARIQF